MADAPATAALAQLRLALDAGAIDRATFDAAVAGINARLVGAGAIAQGSSAMALGAGAVAVLGGNSGSINLGVIIQQGSQPGAGAAELRRAYLARILTQANQLPLFAADKQGSPVRLAAVYTALLTGRSRAHGDDARQALAEARGHDAKLQSALDVLNTEARLVLLGGPGSGKSTFANVVAMSMAGELLGLAAPNLASLTAPVPRDDAGRDGSERAPEPQHWQHGALLPVLVLLRDLASQLPPAGQAIDAQTLLGFIRGRLKACALDGFAPALEAELLERGGLILLDGLDEVPDALERRDQIKRAVQEFAATFSRCRFLVTSRTYAYQRQDWKLDGFAEVQLMPFTPAQTGAFVDAWYRHMVELDRMTEAAAADHAAELKREAGHNPRIRELAERPLLLTLIAKLQTEGGGKVPQKREALYDKAVDMLLNAWESLKVRVLPDGGKDIEPSLAEWLDASRDDIRKQLNRLAFEAHRDQAELTGTADIAQDRLTAALLKASARTDVKVRRLEEYLRDRAGILASHGVDMYQFPHRSFQEYLAACHLTDDEFPDRLAALARADPNRWREVVLLAGAKAARGSMLNAWALGEALCVDAAPAAESVPAGEADQWGALLAGRVLAESADLQQVARRDQAKLERVRDWQLAILRRSTLPAVERALAGRTLALLGDPRAELMTPDGMQFCLVPAGQFAMGSNIGADDEQPQHQLDLPYAYGISRYPVTAAQWRALMPPEREVRGRDNEPVSGVSWHDAMRFCEALTQRWRAALPAGCVVALPSEAEWEKAARGGLMIPAEHRALTWRQLGVAFTAEAVAQASAPNPLPRRKFPWGDEDDADRLNAASLISDTSAVGCFAAGASPYGCEDMAGNVWEWTRSLWGKDLMKPAFKYPYRLDDKREDAKARDDIYRVVRGGSWHVSRDDARCACRGRDVPDDRLNGLGFRVVLRSPPVPKR